MKEDISTLFKNVMIIKEEIKPEIVKHSQFQEIGLLVVMGNKGLLLHLFLFNMTMF